MKRLLILLWLACLPALMKAAGMTLYTGTGGQLTGSKVNCILQDRYGFVWIATEAGVTRFDGNRFVHFTHRSGDPKSLNDNMVASLMEDSRGRLYLGGIQIYNRPDGTMRNLSWTDEAGNEMKPHVLCMRERANGELWAGTTWGIFTGRTDVKGDPQMRSANSRMGIGKESRVNALFEDKEGNLWIGTEEEGLLCLQADGKVSHCLTTEGRKVPVVSDIAQDDEGNLYVSTVTDGLLWKPRGESRLASISLTQRTPPGHGAGATGAEKAVYCLLWQKEEGRLLIGTDGDGLKAWHPRSGRLEERVELHGSPLSLERMKIHALATDRKGNLWIGIYQKGVMMYPKAGFDFAYYGHLTHDGRNLLGDCYVLTLMRASDGALWVGTDNDGLYRIDLKRNTSMHYAPSMGYPRTVMALAEDRRTGDIFLATYHDGLLKMPPLPPGRQLPVRIKKDPNATPRVSCLTLDESGDTLWAGTYGSGLWAIDLRRMDAYHYTAANSPLKDNWITTLYSAPDRRIWAGCSYGLVVYTPGKGLSNPTEGWNHDVLARSVNCLLQDGEGTLYIGTRDGLYRKLRNERSPQLLTDKAGIPLPVPHISSLSEDRGGDLWIATLHGLYRYHPNEQRFAAYYAEDGLQSDEFSGATCHTANGDTLCLGGTDGITLFRPLDVVPHRGNPQLALTAIHVGDHIRLVAPDERHFRFGHDENSLTLEMTAFVFRHPRRIRYHYRINDPEGKWNVLPRSKRSLTLTGLHPGRWRIEVQTEDDGRYSDIHTYTIEILPPWYLSTPARIGYLLLLLAAVALTLWRTRLALKHKRDLQQLKQEDELKESKLQFVEALSHEIRTPVTLITAPLEKMVLDHPGSDGDTFRMMHHNATRVLKITDWLLDLRKMESGNMVLHPSPTNLVPYVGALVQRFAWVADRKHLTLRYLHDPQPVMADIDTAHFDKVVINLLANALKYTPREGEVTLTLQKHEGQVEICVEDTGIGFSKEEAERIFERFYQGKGSKANSGSGIGLHLAYLLTRMHQGTLTAATRTDGPGSRFVVSLPLSGVGQQVNRTATETGTLVTETAATGSPAEVQTATDNPNGKPCIVVVDDEFEILHYLTFELGKEYHVVAHTDAADALTDIRRLQPRIVVSDIQMEGMDGMALCEKIKQNPHTQHIPVVLLSARDDIQDKVQGLEHGAEAYLVKPLHIEELKSTLRSILRRQEREQQSRQLEEIKKEEIGSLEIPSAQGEGICRDILRLINEELDNPDLNVAFLAERLKTNRVRLYRIVKSQWGQTPIDLIRTIRLQQAARLLAEGDATVSEIAYKVGYNSVSHFSLLFKQFYGMQPTEYRESRHP